MNFIRKNLRLIIAIVLINIFALIWITYKFDFIDALFEDGKTTSDEMSPMIFVLMFYVFDFFVSKLVPLVSMFLIIRTLFFHISQKRKRRDTIEYRNDNTHKM